MVNNIPARKNQSFMIKFLKIQKWIKRIFNWKQFRIWKIMCLIINFWWCPESSSTVGTRSKLKLSPIFAGFWKFDTPRISLTVGSIPCPRTLEQAINFWLQLSLMIPWKLMLSLAFHNHKQQNHTALGIPSIDCFIWELNSINNSSFRRCLNMKHSCNWRGSLNCETAGIIKSIFAWQI